MKEGEENAYQLIGMLSRNLLTRPSRPVSSVGGGHILPHATVSPNNTWWSSVCLGSWSQRLPAVICGPIIFSTLEFYLATRVFLGIQFIVCFRSGSSEIGDCCYLFIGGLVVALEEA